MKIEINIKSNDDSHQYDEDEFKLIESDIKAYVEKLLKGFVYVSLESIGVSDTPHIIKKRVFKNYLTQYRIGNLKPHEIENFLGHVLNYGLISEFSNIRAYHNEEGYTWDNSTGQYVKHKGD